jgi:uncharacterized protein (DUF2235 family)
MLPYSGLSLSEDDPSGREMNANDAFDLIAYLETLLGTRRVEDGIERLIRLRENFGPNGFITAEETQTSTWASIHHPELACWFVALAKSDECLVRQWIDWKLEKLRRQQDAQQIVRVETEKVPPIPTGRRRIVVFIDGTTNTPEELRHTSKHGLTNPPPITNVVRLLRGVITNDKSSCPQIIGYFRGVGTEGSVITRTIDVGSGRGLSRTILDAYRFISHNLEWIGAEQPRINRDEIYIFGFSRGAYAARALTGFLNRFGLVKKQALWLLPFFFEAYKKLLASGGNLDPRTKKIWFDNVYPEYQSIPVHFLGIWDTVGALGVPVSGLSWLTVDYEKFHDTSLTPNVTHAYQALAIHELRRPFKPVLWTSKSMPGQIVEQVWFAGAHANVGGGYDRVGLSAYSLDWMAYKAKKVGLELDEVYFAGELEGMDPNEPIAISRRWGHGELGLIKSRKVYLKALERPVELQSINTYLKEYFPAQTMAPDVSKGIMAHWSVAERLAKGPTYVDDKARFERLDILSKDLPEVSRTESLV